MLSRTLVTQVADHVREKILSGELAPGARIVESALAGELAVSRNTLRSALQKLTFEGLLVQSDFKSTHVSSPTAQGVFETYTLRNALESMACRLAASRVADVSTDKLRTSLEQMARGAGDDDAAAVVRADLLFHAAVVEMSGHKLLQEHYNALFAQTRLYLNLTSHLNFSLEYLSSVHHELGRTILAGDVERAAELGGQHSTEDGERLCQWLAEQEGDQR